MPPNQSMLEPRLGSGLRDHSLKSVMRASASCGSAADCGPSSATSAWCFTSNTRLTHLQ
jgi:hypothetical protein